MTGLLSNAYTLFTSIKLSFVLSTVFLLFSSLLLSKTAQANDWKDINWQSYEEARALDSDKPIFVFAELHFCGACKKMKEEVFNQADLIELINKRFVPVNMKAFGIFPNKLSDLKSESGETLSLIGSPALVVVYKDQYKLVYGFQNKAQLQKLLNESLSQIQAANS
jgi:hypothetical protein